MMEHHLPDMLFLLLLQLLLLQLLLLHVSCRLGQHLVQDDRVVATAVLIFIASPASIHHSMLYTEALFTATSWLGLYLLYCCGTSCGASLAFAASSAVRSNGEFANSSSGQHNLRGEI